DPHGRTPPTARVLDDRSRTLIVTLDGCYAVWPRARVLRAGRERIDLDVLMDELSRMNIKRLLVEGGGETIFSFFQAGLVDEYRVYVGNDIIGGRDAPSPADGDGFRADEAVRMKLVSVERFGDGVMLGYEALPR
ncbi:MAG TPA: dihydrofolate reductase family protein, partial [Methanomassiliicoccales archaeon]|nr:dihydrofolate reductase family protein [Methanomassiliicoccales archaeon]